MALDVRRGVLGKYGLGFSIVVGVVSKGKFDLRQEFTTGPPISVS